MKMVLKVRRKQDFAGLTGNTAMHAALIGRSY
jgi:hypothetical protein